MSDNVNQFLNDNSENSDEIVQITIKYKDDPETGLSEIVAIARKADYTFNEKKLKTVIFEYIERKKKEAIHQQDKGKLTATIDGIPVPAPIGTGSFDGIVYDVLENFDKNFLTNLTTG